jgi:hypothetical protein
VSPVRYELHFYTAFRRNSVLKVLVLRIVFKKRNSSTNLTIITFTKVPCLTELVGTFNENCEK